MIVTAGTPTPSHAVESAGRVTVYSGLEFLEALLVRQLHRQPHLRTTDTLMPP